MPPPADVIPALRASLLEFLWPSSCPACRGQGSSDRLCPLCARSLPALAEPLTWLEGGVPVVARFPYQDLPKELLLRMKLRADLVPAKALIAELVESTRSQRGWSRTDAVVAVPRRLPRRLRLGIDQGLVLGRGVAVALGLPFLEGGLTRVPFGPTQSRRSARARRATDHSFRAHGVRDLEILLVDDVLTTGSTLRAASRALVEGGAADVLATVLCRVADPRPAARRDQK